MPAVRHIVAALRSGHRGRMRDTNKLFTQAQQIRDDCLCLKISQARVWHAVWIVQALMCCGQKLLQQLGIGIPAFSYRFKRLGRGIQSRFIRLIGSRDVTSGAQQNRQMVAFAHLICRADGLAPGRASRYPNDKEEYRHRSHSPREHLIIPSDRVRRRPIYHPDQRSVSWRRVVS